jgi:Tfp pilus assembly protein PilF
MNMGACLVELGRLPEAKEMFLSAAELEPSVSRKARLNAALVAVELRQLDEAERLASAAEPLSEDLASRAQEIRSRISEKRGGLKREELLAFIAAATEAVRAGDWTRAEKSLSEAQSRFDVAEAKERVDVLHSLGSAQIELGQLERAKATLNSALELAPNDADVRYALARAYQAADETNEARLEYRHALQLGLAEPNASSARRNIEELDPLGNSDWFAWLSASGGYDSNPRQSGAATETTLGRRGRGGSAYGRLAAEFGRTQRVHENVSLRLRYAGDWLGLQKKTVQDLSLQSHGVFFGAQWAPTERLILGAEVGPSILYIGLKPVSQFTWDLGGSLKLRYLASNVRTWRLSFDARKITGASGWEFLSGTRLDAELTHGWAYSLVNFRLGMRARHLSIGTRTTTVDAAAIPACTNVCDGADYLIPLSYTGVGPIASARVTLLDSLYLATVLQYDWRRYSDESYIVGVDASRKRRVDQRYTVGVDLQWALDSAEHFMVVPSYALLVSSSNVAQSSTVPSHSYDYDDRSFVQHFIELGVEASF